MELRLDENYLAVIDTDAAEFDFWVKALAGEPQPIHEMEPRCGFYRKRMFKAGPFVPVCILPYRERLVCFVDGKQADPADVWTYVCEHPVRRDWYEAKMQGDPWPDEDASVAASLGHNNPPADPAEVLKGQIDAASANLPLYNDIRSDEDAAKAQGVRSRLLELSGEADKKRVAEKEPHLSAGRAVDARWQPLVKQAKEGADRLRAALTAHENRKLAAMPVVTEGPKMEAAKQLRGAYGRAASVRTHKVAVVVDQDAAYGFFKGHEELQFLIGKLAQRTVDLGLSAPPGVEILEQAKVV